MPTVSQLMEWMRSGGEGRLIAAAILYILIWALKSHIPIVNNWLQADGPKLTSKKKKLLANVVLAMSPVAVVLTDTSQSAWDAILIAVGVATSAGGIQSWGKALTHKPDATTPDEADDDEGQGDDGEKAQAGKADADETRRTAAGSDAPADES